MQQKSKQKYHSASVGYEFHSVCVCHLQVTSFLLLLLQPPNQGDAVGSSDVCTLRKTSFCEEDHHHKEVTQLPDYPIVIAAWGFLARTILQDPMGHWGLTWYQEVLAIILQSIPRHRRRLVTPHFLHHTSIVFLYSSCYKAEITRMNQTGPCWCSCKQRNLKKRKSFYMIFYSTMLLT